jgi:glycogen(starch) synthase
VAGYHRLRERFPHDLDLDRARRELAGRFDFAATRAAHRRIWFGEHADG